MKLAIVSLCVLAYGIGCTFAVQTTPMATTIYTTTVDDGNETTSSTLQQQVNDLNTEVDELYDIVEQNEEEANETIAILESEVEKLENRIENLEDDLENAKIKAEMISSLESCQAYYDTGIITSGYYYIDPDEESGPIKPFRVYCNMSAVSGYGVTEFGHDSENRTLVNGCEDPGCYKRNVTYYETMEQIRAVLTISRNCRQFTKYECRGSMMFSYDREVSWLSFDNVRQYYWGGADRGSYMCACGKAGNCNGTSTTCNCDNNDPIWREDYGYVTDRDALPITQLAFGDTDALDEWGYHTLGRLQCYGLNVGDGKTCAEIKQAGYSSGNYSINPNPQTVEDPFEVYCDMESYPGTGVTVIHHNKEAKTKVKTSTYNYDVNVTYDVSLSDIAALTDASEGCTQYVEWLCYRTGFLNQGSYWTDRNGIKAYYWGGTDPNNDKYCSCGEDGTCIGGYNYNCNCDRYTVSTWYKDAGKLIDKSALPVTAMHYGLAYSNTGYYGYYTLGPLKCF